SAVVPVLAADRPGSVRFSGNRQPAEAAPVAHGRVRRIDIRRGPGLGLWRRASGNSTPLNGPGCLAAMDFEDVAVALGIEQHERDHGGGLAGIAPAPAVVQSKR